MNILQNTLLKSTKKLFIATILLHSLIPLYSNCAAEKEHKETTGAADVSAVAFVAHNSFSDQWSLAIEQGDLKSVKRFIAQSACVDTNLTDDQKTTALFTATHLGHVNIVKELLTAGANVNEKNWADLTPLIIACNHGNLDIVRLLLNVKADITTNMDLIYTIKNFYRSIFNNINKEAVSKDVTFLYNHIEIIRLLLENGALVDEKVYDTLSEKYIDIMSYQMNCHHANNPVNTLLLDTEKHFHCNVMKLITLADTNIDTHNNQTKRMLLNRALNFDNCCNEEIINSIVLSGTCLDTKTYLEWFSLRELIQNKNLKHVLQQAIEKRRLCCEKAQSQWDAELFSTLKEQIPQELCTIVQGYHRSNFKEVDESNFKGVNVFNFVDQETQTLLKQTIIEKLEVQKKAHALEYEAESPAQKNRISTLYEHVSPLLPTTQSMKYFFVGMLTVISAHVMLKK